MEKYAETYGVVAYVMLVPSSGSVLEEYMPDGARGYDYESHLPKSDIANIVNIYDTMSDAADKEQVYYRTDHHWTGRGAYEASVIYKEAEGLEVKDYEYYEPYTATDEFYGTLYSKVLDSASVADTMELPMNIPEVSVEISGRDNTLSGIYDNDKLKVKDKYAVFFGGNFGEVVISTGKGTGKNLLVVKDSFANSFVPYLLEDYDNIVMVDLRFFSGSVSEVAEEYNAGNMLVLYEMSNFSHDMNFYKI